jgi:hypothetical protein
MNKNAEFIVKMLNIMVQLLFNMLNGGVMETSTLQ